MGPIRNKESLMPHAHPASVSPSAPHQGQVDTEDCPWCGQPITHEEFQQIKERIQDEERRKRARFQAEMQEQFERKDAERAAKTQAELERIKQDGASAIEQERSKAAEREAVARAEAKKEAQQEFSGRLAIVLQEKELAEKAKEAAERANLEALKLEREKASASLQELQAKIVQLENEREATATAVEEERKKAVEREDEIRAEAKKAVQEEFGDRLAAVQKEKEAAEQAREAAEKANLEALKSEREKAEKDLGELHAKIGVLEKEKQETVEAAQEEREKAAEREAALCAQAKEAAEKKAHDEQELLCLRHQGELLKQRQALEKDKEVVLSQEKARAFSDKQKLELKVGELKRQLESQTAAELGEGAEVDLFNSLRTEFQDDRITRIEKGEPGADIRHEVLYQGEVCGCIIYDSKNRKAWRNSYVEKLRTDQLAAAADHALLSTTVFPAGEQQVCVLEGILVANPARVVVLVDLLREQIIRAHRLRLSGEDRESKTKELYDFVNSDRFEQLLRRAEELTDDLLKLEVKNKEAHERTWQKRGLLLRSTVKAHRDFRFEIERIVGC